MKWTASLASERRAFVIEEAPGVGFYLYVYQRSECVADHLQDTLEAAMEQAEEEYGVERALWVACKSD